MLRKTGLTIKDAELTAKYLNKTQCPPVDKDKYYWERDTVSKDDVSTTKAVSQEPVVVFKTVSKFRRKGATQEEIAATKKDKQLTLDFFEKNYPGNYVYVSDQGRIWVSIDFMAQFKLKALEYFKDKPQSAALESKIEKKSDSTAASSAVPVKQDIAAKVGKAPDSFFAKQGAASAMPLNIRSLLSREDQEAFLSLDAKQLSEKVDNFIKNNLNKEVNAYYVRASESKQNTLVIGTIELDGKGVSNKTESEHAILQSDGKTQILGSQGNVFSSVSEYLAALGKAEDKPADKPYTPMEKIDPPKYKIRMV